MHLLPHEAMNQFTASGLILVLFGGLIAYLKAVPEYLWAWLLRQTTVLITVKDDDPAFDWTKEWMIRQSFIKKVRRVDLNSTLRGLELSLMPAPGKHLFWHHGRPFWLDFTRSSETKGTWEAKRAEAFSFTTIGRNRAILERFVNEVLASHYESKNSRSDLYAWNDYWDKQKSYKGRDLSAVILKNEDKELLLADLRKFLSSSDYYAKLGIPYHRGYVLYGSPGTGKTSLASAVAKEFGMSVYIVNLADMCDKNLKLAMAQVPERSVILFEDIDASGVSKKRVDTKLGMSQTGGVGSNNKGTESLNEAFGVSLSGLLNVLDGFYAPHGVIYIMTTNHIDNIDPALLRPGRIDYKLYLGDATLEQKVALYQRFFPDRSKAEAEGFVKDRPTTETMADFQGMLLTTRD